MRGCCEGGDGKQRGEGPQIRGLDEGLRWRPHERDIEGVKRHYTCATMMKAMDMTSKSGGRPPACWPWPWPWRLWFTLVAYSMQLAAT